MPETTWWHYSVLGTDIKFSKEFSHSVLHPQMPNSVPANCRVLAKGGAALQAFVSFARGQMWPSTSHVCFWGTYTSPTPVLSLPLRKAVGGDNMLEKKQCALQKPAQSGGSICKAHAGHRRTTVSGVATLPSVTICLVLSTLEGPLPLSSPKLSRPKHESWSYCTIKNSELWLSL